MSTETNEATLSANVGVSPMPMGGSGLLRAQAPHPLLKLESPPRQARARFKRKNK